MKKALSVLLIISMLASTGAWASTTNSVNVVEKAVPSINTEEMAQLFEASPNKPLEVATLSPVEMRDTNGAGWGWATPWAAFSAAVFVVALAWHETSDSDHDKSVAKDIMSLTGISFGYTW